MGHSSTRRVLKSIVGPALGATLSALLASCGPTSKSGTESGTKGRDYGDKPGDMAPERDMYAPDAAPPEQLPDPGKQPEQEEKPGMQPQEPIPKVGRVPKPGKVMPKVGKHADPDDDGASNEPRPSRPTRRATDADHGPAVTGLLGGRSIT